MTDYSKLTDAQIDRLVAKRLGWREAVLDDTLLLKYLYATPMDRGHLCLVAPDGHVYGATMKYNADSLWAYLFENEASWATDLNAAAGLDFGEYVFSMIVSGNRRTIQVANPDRLAVYIEQDSRPEARLRAEAWLVYMDAVDKESVEKD